MLILKINASLIGLNFVPKIQIGLKIQFLIQIQAIDVFIRPD